MRSNIENSLFFMFISSTLPYAMELILTTEKLTSMFLILGNIYLKSYKLNILLE